MKRIYIYTLFYIIFIIKTASYTFAQQNVNEEKPMSFRTAYNGGNCNACSWISATGIIEENTPDLFLNFIEKNKQMNTVIINSSGGNLIAGLELGRIFRENKIHITVSNTIKDEYQKDTTEKGFCLSACAYAFLGGLVRSIENDSVIGFHQFYSDSTANSEKKEIVENLISSDQIISGLLASYLAEMGIDIRLLTITSLASKNELFIPSEKDRKLLKITSEAGFGDWKMRAISGGIEAFSERQSEMEVIRVVSAFCSSNDNIPMLTVITEKNDSIKKSEDLISAISSITIKISDNQTEDIKVPSYQIIALVEPDFFSITVTLSRPEQEKILSTNHFFVEIDAPRYLFSGFISQRIDFTDEDKEIVKLAWNNCIHSP